ncbi:MAG: NADH-quinone oxidoreductase subunit J [Anaerolineae bacterium]|jgi:NADH-quinone oxidoreductase subunit J
MNVVFYISAAVAIVSTALAITRMNAVHALLYLIVSLLAVALVFYVLGAPFVAALEVIIYAGAIMVLFLFVVMMLNLGPESVEQEQQWVKWYVWVGPVFLAGILIIELIYILLGERSLLAGNHNVSPTQVAVTLFGPYLLGVELASMVLLAGLIGANRLGRGSTSGRGKGKDR